MAALKTKATRASVGRIIDSIADETKRRDCRTVRAMMRKATGKPPKMGGDGIVGFGSYHYKYASGQEGDWFLTGGSPRKQALTLSIMSGLSESEPLPRKLGKYKTGRACLYIKRLDDVHLPTLKKPIEKSVRRKCRSGWSGC